VRENSRWNITRSRCIILMLPRWCNWSRMMRMRNREGMSSGNTTMITRTLDTLPLSASRKLSARSSSSFCGRRFPRKSTFHNLRNFIRVTGNTFRTDEVPILEPIVIREAERLIAKYKIDFVDCFQIVTIMRGKFRIFNGPSQSILITADRELSRVARAEGARVWECTSEPAPSWLRKWLR
jgi:hypothetical protein